MNNLSAVAPYVLSVSGAAFVTAVLTQVLVKPLLNLIIKPDSPNQNSAIRGMVYVTALTVVLASQFLHYSLNTRTDISTALGAAFVVAATAIGLYHVLDSNDVPTIPLAAAEPIVPASEPVAITQPASEPATPPAA